MTDSFPCFFGDITTWHYVGLMIEIIMNDLSGV